jgi:hypothetical protein
MKDESHTIFAISYGRRFSSKSKSRFLPTAACSLRTDVSAPAGIRTPNQQIMSLLL